MIPWWRVICTSARMPVLPEARWSQAEATQLPFWQSPPFAQSCSLWQPPGGGGGVWHDPPVQTRRESHWLVLVQAWHDPLTHTWPLLQPAFAVHWGGGGGVPFTHLPLLQTSPEGQSLSECQAAGAVQ